MEEGIIEVREFVYSTGQVEFVGFKVGDFFVVERCLFWVGCFVFRLVWDFGIRVLLGFCVCSCLCQGYFRFRTRLVFFIFIVFFFFRFFLGVEGWLVYGLVGLYQLYRDCEVVGSLGGGFTLGWGFRFFWRQNFGGGRVIRKGVFGGRGRRECWRSEGRLEWRLWGG